MNWNWSDATWSGFMGVIATVVNVVFGGAIAVWALRTKTLDKHKVTSDASAQAQLNAVYEAGNRRVENLEKKLDANIEEIRKLYRELGATKVIVARQAVQIEELQKDKDEQALQIEELKQELEWERKKNGRPDRYTEGSAHEIRNALPPGPPTRRDDNS